MQPSIMVLVALLACVEAPTIAARVRLRQAVGAQPKVSHSTQFSVDVHRLKFGAQPESVIFVTQHASVLAVEEQARLHVDELEVWK